MRGKEREREREETERERERGDRERERERRQRERKRKILSVSEKRCNVVLKSHSIECVTVELIPGLYLQGDW